MNFIKLTLVISVVAISCKPEIKNVYVSDLINESQQISAAKQIAELKKEGFEIFDYIDETSGDTIIMQQYFMAFLKSGPNRNQTKATADSLQTLHMAHLSSMYEKGFADISGPFGDDGDMRGITIYNVPTMKIADSLAHLDPMVKAGRLIIEIKPWWAGKGFPLR
ncbi:hypothetical protein ULMS_04840 [Patiriisocius marinistellae]|uniref:YCII-related domain-containing protein n=1 Tax=Patiriisocius marinistellae TaxID=2494560 RepID=A0A5J4FXU9_9FLAO|nr:hypothetical protein [Patiriisocius marinistellae]GEQ84976.1 hypothetical protein ULMS_04840 [Patiriisocius marinistellae]